jgi:hypothetical protein
MISAEEKFEDHRTRDGTGTSLVSTRAHTQSEKTDSKDEGAEAKGRGDRVGERGALQHYLAYDPDKARMEGEGENQCARTHSL